MTEPTDDARPQGARSLEVPPPISMPVVSADCPVRLVEHRPDILDGEAHGFGCLLFRSDGRLAGVGESTWLYTTRPVGEGWESWVRPFDVTTLSAGPARCVLVPRPGEVRAVLHHVIAVAGDLYAGFYCTGRGIAAALAAAPDGIFTPDPNFHMVPEVGWETRDGDVAGWALESNGAHVLEDTATAAREGMNLWLGYDSYRRDGRLGDLGWARVQIDAARRQVDLVGRHPQNPLAFRHPGWRSARCGGNLAGDVRIRGKRAYFYYLRASDSDVFIGLALSDDPLFFSDVEHYVVDRIDPPERICEKFQVLDQGNGLLLLYENQFDDGSWHTGLRRYAFCD